MDKLALLPAVKLPATVSSEAVLDPAAAAARADQLQKARARTELWAEIVLVSCLLIAVSDGEVVNSTTGCRMYVAVIM